MSFFMSLPVSLRQALEILLTISVSVVLNYFLRAFIRVPLDLQTRTRKRYIVIIRNIISIVVAVIVIYIILLIIGINIAPVLASIGFIGVFTAIVVNSIFNDLVGGFFLLSQSNVAVGDYVNVGSNVMGTILSIGIKNMTLRGDDGAFILVPNGQIKTLINYSNGKIRNFIDIPIKMDYSIDEILAMFQSVIDELKQDKDLKIYDESKVIGIKHMDIAAGNVTVTVMIVAPPFLREKIDKKYSYLLLKLLERKRVNKSSLKAKAVKKKHIQ